VYKQILSKCKITHWKERYKTQLTGRSPLRRQRYVLDYSAIEEEEQEEEEEVGFTLRSPYSRWQGSI
jgi:hypothetical protein